MNENRAFFSKISATWEPILGIDSKTIDMVIQIVLFRN